MRKTEPAPPTAAQWVDRLERRVRSVAERSMRVAVLREMLSELDAEHAMSALGFYAPQFVTR